MGTLHQPTYFPSQTLCLVIIMLYFNLILHSALDIIGELNPHSCPAASGWTYRFEALVMTRKPRRRDPPTPWYSGGNEKIGATEPVRGTDTLY